jgi:hypothetical protein
MPNVKDDEPGEAQSNSSSDSDSGARTGAARAAADGAGSATTFAGSALPARPVVAQPGALKATAYPPKIIPKVFTDPSPAFLLPQLPDTKIELKMLTTISEQFLESKPRKIKRLLNTYRYIKVLAHAQAEPVQSGEWQQTMLGWLAFTMTWPSFMARAIEKIEELDPKNEGVLVRAIGKLPGVDSRPSEADVSAYLPISGERIKVLWELAGNFLIENADPGSVSHSDAQVNTRSKSPA